MVLPVRTLLSFFVVTAVMAFVFCLPSRALAQGAPANDKFAKAEVFVFSNLPYSNVNSTTEPGEPSHNPPASALPYHSVWFKYTPLLSGLYFLDLGGNFNTVLAVYTGTAVNKLKRVAWDDNSGINFTSELSVYLTKGVTYHIAIGGNSESDVGQGTLDLRLSHYYTAHTYQGYIDSSDIDLDGGGKITFTTAVSSAVTGRLYLGTRSYPFTAAMTETGTFTASVPRPGQMPVTITAEPSKGSTFPLPPTVANIALTDGVSGMCSVGNISCYLKIGTAQEILVNAIPAAALDPALIPFTSFSSTYRPYSVKNRCPREGRWPFTFELPTGSGYAVATLTVNYLGTCTAAGRLGDGTAFAFSAPMLDPVYGGITNIENSGTFVFHVPLYGLQGRISGTATFSARTSPHNLTGTAVWIRPAPPRGTVFLPTGIYLGMNMYGSRYTAPDPGTRIDAAFTATSGVSLFHTSLEPYAFIDQSVTLTTANTFTYTAPNTHLLKLAVSRASGILTGTVKFTGATALSPVNAVFIHHPTLGTGFFGYVPGKTGYGPVMLQP